MIDENTKELKEIKNNGLMEIQILREILNELRRSKSQH